MTIMSLRGVHVATKQSPYNWETASLRSQRHTGYWCDALEGQLKSAEEEMGRLAESVLVLSQVEGLAGV